MPLKLVAPTARRCPDCNQPLVAAEPRNETRGGGPQPRAGARTSPRPAAPVEQCPGCQREQVRFAIRVAAPLDRCPFCVSSAVRVIAQGPDRMRSACEGCKREWDSVGRMRPDRIATPVVGPRRLQSNVADRPSRAGPGKIATPRLTVSSTAWRIVGESGHPVECLVEPTPGKTWTINVTFGGELMLTETHAAADSASARALELRDGLLRHGWKLS